MSANEKVSNGRLGSSKSVVSVCACKRPNVADIIRENKMKKEGENELLNRILDSADTKNMISPLGEEGMGKKFEIIFIFLVKEYANLPPFTACTQAQLFHFFRKQPFKFP